MGSPVSGRGGPAEVAPDDTPPARPRSLWLFLVGSVGEFCGYALLLSVVPLWASRHGLGELAAGATTGVFMATTVAAQFTMPFLLRRLGYRAALVVGSVLVGAPAPGYLLSAAPVVLFGVSALRGVGFGMITVAGSALAAELVPVAQRARAAGRYGVAVGLPQLVCLPAGVWLAEHAGYPAVFLLAGILPVAAVLPVLAITDPVARRPAAGAATGGPATSGVTRLLGPWVVMLVTTVGAATVLTFLPIAAGGIAPAALFALSAGMLGARWLAGVCGDRPGAVGRLLPLGVVTAGCGLLAVASGVARHGTGPGAAVVVLGAALVGVGFGVVQNESLVLMFHRLGRPGYGLASTVWNVGYDAGTGLGAVVVGAVLAAAGTPTGFALAGASVFVVLPAALLAVRRSRAEAAARVAPER
jgi:hypothetical protein